MRFSTITVLAAIAVSPASGFVPSASRDQLAAVAGRANAAFVSSRTTAPTGAMRMSLDDLESKLLKGPEPAPAKKAPADKSAEAAAKKAAAAEKAAAKKAEAEAKKAAKSKKAAPAPPTPEPVPEPVVVPEPEPEPVKGKKKSKSGKTKSGYVDLGEEEKEVKKAKAAAAPKPAVQKPKFNIPKPTPKPKAPPKEKAPVEADPNALPLGVALGAAPLVVAPVLALSAVKSTLSATKERRAKIQEEIDTFEAEQAAKRDIETTTDGAGVGKALVRFWNV